MRGTLIAASTAALLLTGSAEARSLTIDPGKYGVERIGNFRTSGGPYVHPTVGKAIRAFGQPSNLFPTGAGSCVGKWRRLGLRILFTSFDAPGPSRCRRDVGIAQSFTVERRTRIRTWKGLRVGMTEQELLQRHPRADWVDDSRFFPPAYWLKTAISPIGEPSPTPVVHAELRDGRVWRIAGWIGGAGD